MRRMRTVRFVARGRLGARRVRRRRRPVRPERRWRPRSGCPTLPGLHGRACAWSRRNYVEKVESDRLVYSAITACCRRSTRTRASWTRGPTRRCASGRKGRYYGLGITIQVDRRRHHRRAASSRARRPTRRASAAATSSRRSTARTPRAGPASRPSRKLRGPKGTHRSRSALRRRGYDQLIELEVHARRDQHPDASRRAFMIDATTGYIRLQDFAEHTDDDLGDGARRR